jgi:hypothetical protein
MEIIWNFGFDQPKEENRTIEDITTDGPNA